MVKKMGLVILLGVLGWGVVGGGAWLIYTAYQDHKIIQANAAMTGQIVTFLQTQIAANVTPGPTKLANK